MTVRRHNAFLLLAGLVVFLLLLLSGLFFHREPLYHGKTVREWAFQISAPADTDRKEAAAVFRVLGSNAVPSLVLMLNAHNSFLHKRVWITVSGLPPKLRHAVVRVLRPPTAMEQHRDAARVIKLIGPDARGAIPALSLRLRDDKDWTASWEAAGALAAIGRSSVPVLTQILTDRSPNARRNAAYALGAIGTNAFSAAPALFDAMDDPQSIVRGEAAMSLAKLGPDVPPYLTNLMASPNPAIRIKATRSLGGLHPSRMVVRPALLLMLQDPDSACRVQAAQTMSCVGLPDRSMVEGLIQALDDPSANVRLAAVQSLNSARPHAVLVIPAITKSLADPSPEVREAATRVLTNFTPKPSKGK